MASDLLGAVEVEVRLRRGREVAARVEHVLGDPRSPLPWVRLAEKFRGCVAASPAHVTGADVSSLVDAVHDLEASTDVGALLAPFCGGTRSRS